ncbi:MAG: pilus assembly protein PilM [Tepidisphaeraceae bacterium]
MFRLNRPQIQPIGVDIGHDSVKMLQLEAREQSLVVHASARRTLDVDGAAAGQSSPAELISPQAAQAIRELLSGGNFAGRAAVVALPRHVVHVKNLRLPPMPPGELASVIDFEARGAFPFDTAEAHVEFLVAGEVRQGTDIRQEVVVLAARNADVDRFVEQLHRTGLVIDSLDVEPCALYRTVDRFVRRREDEQEVHVLVDVGTRCTQVLIGKGRDISFFKAIEMGGADFNLAVSRKLGIRPDEARALRRRLSEQDDGEHPDTVRLAVLDASRGAMESLTREVSLCLRYHSVTFRGQRPLKVRVSGGEGGDPQLLAMLHSVLGIPVEPSRPLFSIDCTAMRGFDHRKPSGDWAVAMGLGLKRSAGRFAPMDGTPRAAAPAALPTPSPAATLPAAARATEAAPSAAAMPREAVHA